MQGPLLTVLMPVYNAELFLKEAIDSILCQSLRNFEFLIIDDGSTDKSVEIIRSYTDPRIRFIQNEKNLGITATLNKGIEASSTELIARMDADDISYADRLEKQYHYFQQHPDCVLLSTWAREITEEGKSILVEEYQSDHHFYALNFECWIYHPTVMYRKSAVKDVGMYQDFYSEDFDLWWRISRKYKIACLMQVLLDYRLSNESISRIARRTEYQEAHHEQVIRNLRYYVGDNFRLTYAEVECYRYNFVPITELKNVTAYSACVKKLDYINKKLLRDSNVNAKARPMREIAAYKRGAIVDALTQNLSRKEKIKFCLLIGEQGKIFDMLVNNLLRLARKLITLVSIA